MDNAITSECHPKTTASHCIPSTVVVSTSHSEIHQSQTSWKTNIDSKNPDPVTRRLDFPYFNHPIDNVTLSLSDHPLTERGLHDSNNLFSENGVRSNIYSDIPVSDQTYELPPFKDQFSEYISTKELPVACTNSEARWLTTSRHPPSEFQHGGSEQTQMDIHLSSLSQLDLSSYNSSCKDLHQPTFWNELDSCTSSSKDFSYKTTNIPQDKKQPFAEETQHFLQQNDLSSQKNAEHSPCELVTLPPFDETIYMDLTTKNAPSGHEAEMESSSSVKRKRSVPVEEHESERYRPISSLLRRSTSPSSLENHPSAAQRQEIQANFTSSPTWKVVQRKANEDASSLHLEQLPYSSQPNSGFPLFSHEHSTTAEDYAVINGFSQKATDNPPPRDYHSPQLAQDCQSEPSEKERFSHLADAYLDESKWNSSEYRSSSIKDKVHMHEMLTDHSANQMLFDPQPTSNFSPYVKRHCPDRPTPPDFHYSPRLLARDETNETFRISQMSQISHISVDCATASFLDASQNTLRDVVSGNPVQSQHFMTEENQQPIAIFGSGGASNGRTDSDRSVSEISGYKSSVDQHSGITEIDLSLEEAGLSCEWLSTSQMEHKPHNYNLNLDQCNAPCKYNRDLCTSLDLQDLLLPSSSPSDFINYQADAELGSAVSAVTTESLAHMDHWFDQDTHKHLINLEIQGNEPNQDGQGNHSQLHATSYLDSDQYGHIYDCCVDNNINATMSCLSNAKKSLQADHINNQSTPVPTLQTESRVVRCIEENNYVELFRNNQQDNKGICQAVNNMSCGIMPMCTDKTSKNLTDFNNKQNVMQKPICTTQSDTTWNQNENSFEWNGKRRQRKGGSTNRIAEESQYERESCNICIDSTDFHSMTFNGEQLQAGTYSSGSLKPPTKSCNQSQVRQLEPVQPKSINEAIYNDGNIDVVHDHCRALPETLSNRPYGVGVNPPSLKADGLTSPIEGGSRRGGDGKEHQRTDQRTRRSGRRSKGSRRHQPTKTAGLTPNINVRQYCRSSTMPQHPHRLFTSLNPSEIQQLAMTAYSLASKSPSAMLEIPCGHINPPCPSCIIRHCTQLIMQEQSNSTSPLPPNPNHFFHQLRTPTSVPPTQAVYRLPRSPTARAAIVHYPHPPVPIQHLPRFRHQHQQHLFDEFARSESDPMRVQLGHFIVEHCTRSIPDEYLRSDMMTPDPHIVTDFVDQIIMAVEIFGEHAHHNASRDAIPTDINETYISRWLQQNQHLLNPLEILHRRREKRSAEECALQGLPTTAGSSRSTRRYGGMKEEIDESKPGGSRSSTSRSARETKSTKTRRKIGVSLGEELDGLGVPRMVHFENLKEAIAHRGLVVQLPSNGHHHASCTTSSNPYLSKSYSDGPFPPSYYRYNGRGPQPRLLFNLLIAGRGDTRRSKMELPWGATVKIKYNRTLLGIPDFVVESLGYGATNGHHLIPKVCAVSLEDSAYGVEVLLFYRGLPCSKRQTPQSRFLHNPGVSSQYNLGRSLRPPLRYHVATPVSLQHQQGTTSQAQQEHTALPHPSLATLTSLVTTVQQAPNYTWEAFCLQNNQQYGSNDVEGHLTQGQKETNQQSTSEIIDNIFQRTTSGGVTYDPQNKKLQNNNQMLFHSEVETSVQPDSGGVATGNHETGIYSNSISYNVKNSLENHKDTARPKIKLVIPTVVQGRNDKHFVNQNLTTKPQSCTEVHANSNQWGCFSSDYIPVSNASLEQDDQESQQFQTLSNTEQPIARELNQQHSSTHQSEQLHQTENQYMKKLLERNQNPFEGQAFDVVPTWVSSNMKQQPVNDQPNSLNLGTPSQLDDVKSRTNLLEVLQMSDFDAILKTSSWSDVLEIASAVLSNENEVGENEPMTHTYEIVSQCSADASPMPHQVVNSYIPENKSSDSNFSSSKDRPLDGPNCHHFQSFEKNEEVVDLLTDAGQEGKISEIHRKVCSNLNDYLSDNCPDQLHQLLSLFPEQYGCNDEVELRNKSTKEHHEVSTGAKPNSIMMSNTLSYINSSGADSKDSLDGQGSQQSLLGRASDTIFTLGVQTAIQESGTTGGKTAHKQVVEYHCHQSQFLTDSIANTQSKTLTDLDTDERDDDCVEVIDCSLMFQCQQEYDNEISIEKKPLGCRNNHYMCDGVFCSAPNSFCSPKTGESDDSSLIIPSDSFSADDTVLSGGRFGLNNKSGILGACSSSAPSDAITNRVLHWNDSEDLPPSYSDFYNLNDAYSRIADKGFDCLTGHGINPYEEQLRLSSSFD